MGMHLAKLPDGTIVEVWDRPEPAKPTSSKLDTTPPEAVCHCFCHVRLPGEDATTEGPDRDSGCDECFDGHWSGKYTAVAKHETGMTLMPFPKEDA